MKKLSIIFFTCVSLFFVACSSDTDANQTDSVKKTNTNSSDEAFSSEENTQ